MFYMTCCISDTLALSRECIEELFVQYYDTYSKMFDVNNYIKHLSYKEDCLEYQDFTGFIKDQNKEVLDILLKYKVNGNVCFIKMKGVNNADLFGYEFKNGQCNKITGIPFWFDQDNNQI